MQVLLFYSSWQTFAWAASISEFKNILLMQILSRLSQCLINFSSAWSEHLLARKYWYSRYSGNRYVLPIFVLPPKDQTPLDLWLLNQNPENHCLAMFGCVCKISKQDFSFANREHICQSYIDIIVDWFVAPGIGPGLVSSQSSSSLLLLLSSNGEIRSVFIFVWSSLRLK